MRRLRLNVESDICGSEQIGLTLESDKCGHDKCVPFSSELCMASQALRRMFGSGPLLFARLAFLSGYLLLLFSVLTLGSDICGCEHILSHL